MLLYLHNGAWRSPVAHLLWEQGVAGSNPAAPTWKARHGNELPCRAFSPYQGWDKKWGRLFPFFLPHTGLTHIPRLIHDCQERLGVWLLIVGQKGLRITLLDQRLKLG